MKLLVVEDDRMLSELIRRALTEDGFAVDIASDGEQAETDEQSGRVRQSVSEDAQGTPRGARAAGGSCPDAANASHQRACSIG